MFNLIVLDHCHRQKNPKKMKSGYRRKCLKVVSLKSLGIAFGNEASFQPLYPFIRQKLDNVNPHIPNSLLLRRFDFDTT